MGLGPRQKKLAEALKSGKYPKCKDKLETHNGFCCLGVACKIAEEDGVKVIYTEGLLSGTTLNSQKDVLDYFKFNSHSGRSTLTSKYLVNINDFSETFQQVIEALEDPNNKFFTEEV